MPKVNEESYRDTSGAWIIDPSTKTSPTEEELRILNAFLKHSIKFMWKEEEIGIVTFYLTKHGRAENRYELVGLNVLNKYRRKGIATFLIKKGQEFASIITLQCLKRPELIELYEKCAFKITGEGPRALTGEEQVLMEWRKQ